VIWIDQAAYNLRRELSEEFNKLADQRGEPLEGDA
jgi:hypothetical protein